MTLLIAPQPVRLTDLPAEVRALIDRDRGFVLKSFAAATGVIALSEFAALSGLLVSLLVSVIGQGLFLEKVLADRLAVLRPRQAEMFLALAIAGMLTFIPVLFGIAFFVLPGALLLGSWAAAGPVIVAEGRGAVAGLGESWRLTAGSRLRLMGLYAVIVIASVMMGGLIGVFPLFGTSVGSGLVERLGYDLLTAAIYLASWLLSAAIYRLAKPRGSELDEVFS